MKSCDPCGRSCHALHFFESSGLEGYACCACMDCFDPNECAEEQNPRSALNQARRRLGPDEKDRS